MNTTSKTLRTQLKEIWSLHVKIGRWSLFIGFGEVRRI